MDSLVALDSYDPELQKYLVQQEYPALMEALLTGLAVMVPQDPWQFIGEKLSWLRDAGGSVHIHSDMFVDAEHLPRVDIFRRGLDALIDDTDLPTQEMFEKVFEFRKMKLQRLCFDAWRVFYHQEKKENEAYRQRQIQAKTYHTLKVEREIFDSWRSYTAHKNRCRLSASHKLLSVGNSYMVKLLFHAWLDDYKESRRAKHWFNREAGPEGEGEDESEWCWPEGEDHISLLPREIAIKVFMLLGIQALCRCGRVCRAWKDITEDPQLWNKINLYSIRHFIGDEEVMRICHKYRPLLCHLNLRGCTNLSSNSLRAIGYCKNLQDLNLSESQGINEEVIQSVGKGCAGLLYLNLSYCYITDSIMRILTKYFCNLHYLSLAYSYHFTSKGLHSITVGKGCRRIVYFDLSGCTQLSAEGLGYIGKGCPILHTLLLDNIPECNDSMILMLAGHCRSLRHISFLGGSKVGDRALKFLAKQNKKLRVVKIENNSVLTDVTLRGLVKDCKELNHLHLAGCSRVTDQGLKALSFLKKLQVLNIADCTRVSETGIRYLIEPSDKTHKGVGQMHRGPGQVLKELNLTNLNKIGDVTMLRIYTNCKSLTCLSVCYCEHISDSGVELLGRMSTLTSLDLSGCSIQDEGIRGLGLCNKPRYHLKYLMLAELDITDDGLQRMSSNLSKLDTLDLSDCEQVTDAGIEQVTFNCRMLRILYVANCPKVTDAGTKCIARGCPYIYQLDMSGCSITDRSLSLLRKFSSNLQRLDILCCVDVTREAVLKLKRVEVNYNTEQPKYLQDGTETPLPNMPVQPLLDRI